MIDFFADVPNVVETAFTVVALLFIGGNLALLFFALMLSGDYG